MTPHHQIGARNVESSFSQPLWQLRTSRFACMNRLVLLYPLAVSTTQIEGLQHFFANQLSKRGGCIGINLVQIGRFGNHLKAPIELARPADLQIRKRKNAPLLLSLPQSPPPPPSTTPPRLDSNPSAATAMTPPLRSHHHSCSITTTITTTDSPSAR